MKFLPLLLLTFPMLLAAEEPKDKKEDKLAELVTLNGKLYQDVTIRKVEPDGLSILHAAGTAKVPFEQLSSELQEKYGYTKEAAAEHKEKMEEARLRQAEAEQVAREKREKATADHTKKQANEELTKNLQKAAVMVQMHAFQDSRIGLIGRLTVGTLVSEPVKSKMGSTIRTEQKWRYRTQSFNAIISEATGADIKRVSHSYEVPYGLPSYTTRYFAWEGKGWRIGKIRYKDRDGIITTIPYYTADESVASEFFKKNGFGKASENVILEIK
ncbi:hypothetical protein OKA04_16730 [Luteolibacter flavescens]|uniref:Uncharacterized protein n=1 Tax=Luteolibacter flavescens TaxID=1859460 RepID=A0ABT3FS41_9BACT|nr:hypothetical protein [Luteolibacter flavescens]MCW1886385.1 hypothetical protein [Luteolibacter flavescens]